MITAVDSSVLIDVLTDDARYAGVSESALRKARREGSTIVCGAALAEVVPVLEEGVVDRFLKEWELVFVPASRESSLLAGSHFYQYLRRGGKRGRVLADFLIGAHAQFFAQRLLTRDRGYYRDYFKSLAVWEP